MISRRRFLHLLYSGATLSFFSPWLTSCAEWTSRNARYSLRGPWNKAVLRKLPELFVEFNGINYGHALLAKTLLRTDDPNEIERARLIILRFIQSRPQVSPDEEQVASVFIRLVWELQSAFNWAHRLHADLYDLFAFDGIGDKNSAYDVIIQNYLSKPEAITAHRLDLHGKLWSFPESRSFERRYPKLNAQIWVYHWFQAKVAEIQMAGGVEIQRKLLTAVIKQYHEYLLNPPEWEFMPMFEDLAPSFSRLFPKAAAIFNNLHMMHDNVDDILSRRDLYPDHSDIRKAILKTLEIYLHRNHFPHDRYAEYHVPHAVHSDHHH